MKLVIKELTWDTDFFGIKIGELVNLPNVLRAFTVDAEYELIVLKQLTETNAIIVGYDKCFEESKVFYSKNELKSQLNDSLIKDADFNPVVAADLYSLAFISGAYSRFNLDTKIPKDKFEELYMAWVDNSLNKLFADKVLFIQNDECLLGFVTISKKDDHAVIGLIAVAEESQGKGYGKKLLLAAENYCVSEHIKELRIPTQLKNKLACQFYRKNGYSAIEEVFIKHYWKKYDTI